MTLMHALQGERHRAVTTQQLPNGFTRRLAMVLGVVICLVVALSAQKGYTDDHLPTSQTMTTKLNELGYFPKKVATTKPQNSTNRCHL